MADKISRQEMDRILADRRHKEMVAYISGLTNSVEKENSGTKIDAIINALNGHLEKVLEISRPEINIDQTAVVKALGNISSNLIDLKAAVNAKPTEYEATVKRDEYGRMILVNLKAKQ
jgi:hypothetical protein